MMMERFRSQINTSSEEFITRRAEMLEEVEKLNEVLKESLEQGRPKEIERQLKRGQLLGGLFILCMA